MAESETFVDKSEKAIRAKKSILIVGLDPQFGLMPPPLKADVEAEYGHGFEAVGRLFYRFNKDIIRAVADYAYAVKPQMAFYEKYGHWGVWAFEETVYYAKSQGLVVIEDGKRGDGGDTADAYADGHIGTVDFWDDPDQMGALTRVTSPIRVDCLTVQPYLADDCVTRFVRAVKEHGTGIFVVTKSSFRPNSRVEQLMTVQGLKVWQVVAHLVKEWGEGTEGRNGYRNVGVVMGATYPTDAPFMREILPNSWFLIPGYGGQGGTADEAVVGVNTDGLGGGVNSSRAINYAYRKGSFACEPRRYAWAAEEAARASRDELNEALKRAGKWVY